MFSVMESMQMWAGMTKIANIDVTHLCSAIAQIQQN
jgi:hypothetical protein